MVVKVQFNDNELAFENNFEAFQTVTEEVPVSDYDDIINKPSINGVELKGDLTFEDLGIKEIPNSTIEEIARETLFGVVTVSST